MKEEAKVASALKPLEETLEQDLQKAGEKVERQLSRRIMEDAELREYRVAGTEEEWRNALKKGASGLVSIPISKKRDGDDPAGKGASGKKMKKGKKGHKKH